MEETIKSERTIRTHKIGTVTFGVLLVLFGTLFLLHLFVPVISYRMIFALWPCIFIFLGIEVLFGSRLERRAEAKGEERMRFVYDKASVVLMVILTGFAMVMAGADVLFRCWSDPSLYMYF